jgi:hypothetical protein
MRKGTEAGIDVSTDVLDVAVRRDSDRRSDRQRRADRLDAVDVAVGVDERHHHLGRRSSSAWAKHAKRVLLRQHQPHRSLLHLR